MSGSLQEYCVQNNRYDLLEQWNYARNVGLTPADVTYGSKKKVWWRCGKGHEWQTAVYVRTGSNSGCPYCTGKQTASGESDLLSQRPDLAAQWHPTKNGAVTPDCVSLGSHKTVWWICEKGHEWRAMVKTRVRGYGCPVCTNRVVLSGVNDLASTHPDIAQQWHPEKNGSLTPRDVLAGSLRKVWWRCEKGHEWQAFIGSRTNGNGCPVCAGKYVISGENDLASLFPVVAAQWHEKRNGALTPGKVSPYSNRKVWWRCELGHEYQALVSSRTMNGSDCPYCTGRKVLSGFNDLATREPQIAAQWHPTLNGMLTPAMVTVGSHKKVWWRCGEGHEWQAFVYSRAGKDKCGCPICSGRYKQVSKYRR